MKKVILSIAALFVLAFVLSGAFAGPVLLQIPNEAGQAEIKRVCNSNFLKVASSTSTNFVGATVVVTNLSTLSTNVMTFVNGVLISSANNP